MCVCVCVCVCVYVPDFRAFMSRPSCVHPRFSSVNIQSFVRSPDGKKLPAALRSRFLKMRLSEVSKFQKIQIFILFFAKVKYMNKNFRWERKLIRSFPTNFENKEKELGQFLNSSAAFIFKEWHCTTRCNLCFRSGESMKVWK